MFATFVVMIERMTNNAYAVAVGKSDLEKYAPYVEKAGFSSYEAMEAHAVAQLKEEMRTQRDTWAGKPAKKGK